MAGASIEAIKLVKKFGQLTAVKGVSFKVMRGELYALLGPNGAGKTTTIKMLTTLLKPTSGEAYIEGYSVLRDTIKVRKIIGLIPQDLTADDEMSGWENVLIQAKLYGYKGREAEERARRSLEIVDLWEAAHRRVSTYSGGMRRRLEIAMSLVHDPQVLFLDEPTLGLDVQSRRAIWDLIREFKKNSVTIMLTTHYMEEAEALSDRVAIIDAGEIKAEGAPEDLKSKLGGDKVYIEALTLEDAKAVFSELSQRGFNVKLEDSTVIVKVPNAATSLPEMAGVLSERRVKSVNIVRPNLEEVFLELTGRRLREEAFDSFRFRVLSRKVR
ncbi:MAG: ATP-binding cassette domain-containing protein [Thermoprotei archaeon]|nr:ATP-binding cassette domain-containing protein [Thermoprotei archaeon]